MTAEGRDRYMFSSPCDKISSSKMGAREVRSDNLGGRRVVRIKVDDPVPNQGVRKVPRFGEVKGRGLSQ